MRTFFAVGLLAAFAPVVFAASDPFAGRWDLTLTNPKESYPNWMEIVEKDGKLDGRIQPRGGSVRPIVSATRQGPRLILTVARATPKTPEVTWELSVAGNRISGLQKRGTEGDTQIAGVRAPELTRKAPKAWSKSEPLFNGKDLAGWEPVRNPENSHWVAENGTLLNSAKGSNLRTTRTFQDFKLHIEVNCPPHCNSGIYLRGRYEIQVGSEGGTRPQNEMGAVYGYFAPAKPMPLGSGEWNVFDITLVGRRVTVVRNGVVIHENQELPGITGGALDSNESDPGPIFLQGDHDGGMRYRNITVSVPKS